LSDYSDFTRWRIIGGDRTNWPPYGSAFFDTLALDGLFALAGGDVAGALAKWSAIRDMSGFTYEEATQGYRYPSIHENYHLGLFTILTEQLLGEGLDAAKGKELLQHAIALRANLLDHQEHQPGTGAPLGWRSDFTDPGALMNVESVVVGVLALGARANAVFEPGVPPMASDASSYFVRPYHAISAVVGLSQPGLMTKGPGFLAPPGTYQFDFALRAPSPTGTVATLEVYDAAADRVLASHDVASSEMVTGNQWTRITVAATVSSACNRIELRTRWTGTGNLDVGPIRVR
jgi:hypothetical protein